MLVMTQEAVTKEGCNYGNWTVLLKFKSEESANMFYNSEAYAPLKKLRIENYSNSGNLVLLPSLR